MPGRLSAEQVNEVINNYITVTTSAFKQFDYNDNGILSLAEIDNAVICLYPQFADKKPVLMRAYKAADASKQLDKNKDKRISFEEFKKGYKLMGICRLSNDEIKAEFDKIDTNHGGYILFDEVKLIIIFG
ncbi:22415_t:CDS:2, partial [Cetraspora pellucida]